MGSGKISYKHTIFNINYFVQLHKKSKSSKVLNIRKLFKGFEISSDPVRKKFADDDVEAVLCVLAGFFPKTKSSANEDKITFPNKYQLVDWDDLDKFIKVQEGKIKIIFSGDTSPTFE